MITDRIGRDSVSSLLTRRNARQQREAEGDLVVIETSM